MVRKGCSAVDSIFKTKIARLRDASIICFVIHTPSSGKSGSKREEQEEEKKENALTWTNPD
ncbi:hypothetical protein ANN_19671 [Periplaneta americana]|uniref:Uncharacterized protein n=1 Tax=Periplaneta americana TaxID=6978 RepID=A0ABQ8SBK9_PERAM|nr:hypothetical protein ANN_19671 [Periplaneta americana]